VCFGGLFDGCEWFVLLWCVDECVFGCWLVEGCCVGFDVFDVVYCVFDLSLFFCFEEWMVFERIVVYVFVEWYFMFEC